MLRLVCVGRAWRNIIQASYPKTHVAARSILGAIFAGAGVNAIIPARGGDAVRVVLAVAIVLLLWFAERIGDFRQRLAQGFAILKDRPAYLRKVVLWQVADWTCRLIGVLFFLSAFGLPVTVHNALLVLVAAGLASLLPISPSGIGTEQAFLLYLLRDQASRAALLAFSVGMRITLIVANLALGFGTLLIWFRSTDWRAHATQESAR